MHIQATEKEVSLQEQKKADRKSQKKQKQEHIKQERNQQKAQLKTSDRKGVKRPHDGEEVRCLLYHLWQKVKVVFFAYTCILYICHFLHVGLQHFIPKAGAIMCSSSLFVQYDFVVCG